MNGLAPNRWHGKPRLEPVMNIISGPLWGHKATMSLLSWFFLQIIPMDAPKVALEHSPAVLFYGPTISFWKSSAMWSLKTGGHSQQHEEIWFCDLVPVPGKWQKGLYHPDTGCSHWSWGSTLDCRPLGCEFSWASIQDRGLFLTFISFPQGVPSPV